MDDFISSLGMPDPDRTIGITGRRRYENPFYIRDVLRTAFLHFYSKGMRHIIVGGALGVDMAAAKEVIKLKREGGMDSLVLTVAIPFPDFTSQWSESNRQEFNKIWKAADYTLCLGSKGYAPVKYLVRNEYIVSNSSILLAVWEGSESGGTYNTIKIARKLGVPVYRVCPKLKKKGWVR